MPSEVVRASPSNTSEKRTPGVNVTCCVSVSLPLVELASSTWSPIRVAAGKRVDPVAAASVVADQPEIDPSEPVSLRSAFASSSRVAASATRSRNSVLRGGASSRSSA